MFEVFKTSDGRTVRFQAQMPTDADMERDEDFEAVTGTFVRCVAVSSNGNRFDGVTHRFDDRASADRFVAQMNMASDFATFSVEA